LTLKEQLINKKEAAVLAKESDIQNREQLLIEEKEKKNYATS